MVTSYSYSGDGLLAQWQQGASTNKLTWDLQNLLQETNGSNVTQVTYTLEPLGFGNLVSARRLVGGNWTRRYYHYNNIGTTDRLTDETQAVTDRYQLDPWGKVYSTTGTTVNPFRYVGQLGYYQIGTSALTDENYVRARHYEPYYGRWWSRDDGSDEAAYGYCSNLPISYIDPLGLFGLGIISLLGLVNPKGRPLPTKKPKKLLPPVPLPTWPDSPENTPQSCSCRPWPGGSIHVPIPVPPWLRPKPRPPWTFPNPGPDVWPPPDAPFFFPGGGFDKAIRCMRGFGPTYVPPTIPAWPPYYDR